MKKSSNSDSSEFVCLTKNTISEYIHSIPFDVEEITIWNYKMCINPQLLKTRYNLTIPHLNYFSNLKCIKFYNERFILLPGTFPPNIKKIYFVSCIVNNKWTNVCIYGNNLTYIPLYQSVIMIESPVIGLLKYNSTEPQREIITPKKKSLMAKKKNKQSWFCWFRSFQFLRFFRTNNERVSPTEVEMVQYITLEPQNTKHLVEYDENDPSLESIQRFKKTYDLLVDEGIIKVLISEI
jgi:hypothetical protein